jgi:class 3 adenylate cyclase
MRFTLKIRERFLIALLLLAAALLGTVWILLNARFLEWKNRTRQEEFTRSAILLNQTLQQKKTDLSSQAGLIAERLSSDWPGHGTFPLPGAAFSFSKLCLEISSKTRYTLFIVTDRTGRVLFDSYQLPENLLSIRQGRPLLLKASQQDLSSPPLSAATWPNVSKALEGSSSDGIFVYGMSFIPKALADQRLAFQSITLPLIPSPGSPIEGVLILGFPLDASFAQNLKSITGNGILVEIGGRVLSSTWGKTSFKELEEILSSVSGKADAAAASGIPAHSWTILWGTSSYDTLLLPILDPRGIRIGHYVMLQSRPSAEALRDSLRRTILISGLLGLVLTFALGWLLTRPITSALESLQKAADQTGPRSPHPVPVQGPDEVAHLTGSLNNMWTRHTDQERVRHILGKKVAPDVSRKIISSGDELAVKGERRQCTVLFARINGLRPLEVEKAPDQWMADLNEILEKLSTTVFEQQGTLDHFGAGTIKAVWGAPILLEGQNEWALRAAFEMRENIEDFSKKRMSRGEPPLSVCLGLHAGSMLAGYLGTDQNSDYTVLGVEAEKAEALSKQAFPGQILVSGSFFKSLSSKVVFNRVTHRPTPSQSETEPCYEAVAWAK